MRTAILFSLGSTAVAVPLADAFNAVLGRDPAPHTPHTRDLPFSRSFRPFPTGTGGFPTRFPSATRPCGGAGTAPAGTGLFSALPNGPLSSSKSLNIDYDLAPTVTFTPENEKRQQTGLPSFTLADPPRPTGSGRATRRPSSTIGLPLPSGTDTETPELPHPTPSETGAETELPIPTSIIQPPFPIPSGTRRVPNPTGGFPRPTGSLPTRRPQPTGGRPSGRPSGRPTRLPSIRPTGRPSGLPTGRPRPTGGRPPFPSTLATRTRGPRPTAIPQPTGFPDRSENAQEFWDALRDFFLGRNNGN